MEMRAIVCTPASLSQEVGTGLGAQAGEGRLAEVAREAGFASFRRATETPFNLVLEVVRKPETTGSALPVAYGVSL